MNRPALQLTGFFEHFDSERVQVIGYVEYTYLQTLSENRKKELYKKLMSYGIPCLIFSTGLIPDEQLLQTANEKGIPVFSTPRKTSSFMAEKKLMSYGIPCLIFSTGLIPDEQLLQTANEKGIPVFSTPRKTSSFMAEMIRWLNVELAPQISIHGVLVDVYGVGVLIMGESGIGKSEAALELIKRGHRLVTDDVVEISKVSDDTLVGTAPDITRHLIELRGIGIIDVKMLFGVQSVRQTQTIDLVITLEDWNKDKEYDRLGLEEEYTEFLGNKVVCHSIPIRPGRNLAIIVESAAANFRQKKMGYNAAQELYRRVQENLTNKR